MRMLDGYSLLVCGLVCGWVMRGLTAHSTGVVDLCADERCSCTPLSVSCHCSPQDQEATLSIDAASVPRDARIVTIDGCRDVIFASGAISQHQGLDQVNILDVGKVLFQRASFDQAQVKRKVTVRIGRCRQLVVESRSIRGNAVHPLSFNSSQCHSVDVDESAFSGVALILLTDIHQLQLSSLAFRFVDQTNLNIATNITIRNVNIKDLKSFTFASPLDHLALVNASIERMETNATSAIRITSLVMADCQIGHVDAVAFSQLTLFDSLRLSSSSIKELAGKALASATSSLIIEDCRIERMGANAVSMPAAEVLLRRNRIERLATGSLHLREWNDLLIEDNTFVVVERQAFYNIGEPKFNDDVRFVMRNNVVEEALPGAFIFSAQVLKLRLVDNRFRKPCDCSLVTWTADLTQVKRRSENSLFSDNSSGIPVSEALWLGSSLFNNSSCWIDTSITECTSLEQVGALSMSNYTSQYCGRADVIGCVASRRQFNAVVQSASNQSSLVNNYGFFGIRSIGLDSRQDVVLVIITALLASAVLLALLLTVVYVRRRSKQPTSAAATTAKNAEDRITCTPLMEGSLGSGVVSSGSISRLSVNDYNSYLQELGPIYSEPMDPPLQQQQQPEEVEEMTWPLIPPQIPAIPVEWGTKSTSLAHEFTQEILAAFNDRLEVSPTYSQVKDSIPQGDPPPPPIVKDTPSSGTQLKELYDQITVLESPSILPAGSEHIYCKPWEEAAESSVQDRQDPPSGLQPFYMRGSLPKWPPSPAATPESKSHRSCASSTPRSAKFRSNPPKSPFPFPVAGKSAPPKPARVASPTTVCDDYADPRDVTEHLYSELRLNPL